MNIVDKKNAAKEIANLITTKAMYQKVVFCLDENSDTKLLDEVCDTVGRNAIIIKYIYSKKSTPDFFNLINNGVRIVVYNVASENYYRVKNDNSFMLNVFVAQSDFVLPYIGCVDSLYGHNMLVVNKSGRDYCSVLRMYELALDDIIGRL